MKINRKIKKNIYNYRVSEQFDANCIQISQINCDYK